MLPLLTAPPNKHTRQRHHFYFLEVHLLCYFTCLQQLPFYNNLFTCSCKGCYIGGTLQIHNYTYTWPSNYLIHPQQIGRIVVFPLLQVKTLQLRNGSIFLNFMPTFYCKINIDCICHGYQTNLCCARICPVAFFVFVF